MFRKQNPKSKYLNVRSNRKPRDFWGPNMCCRRSRDQMYCKCPTPLEGIHPIIDGEYIWYTLDPDIGFINSDDNARMIDDKGNTLVIHASGRHDGHMYSGTSLTLMDQGHITIPVETELDSIVYFDAGIREFVQIVNDQNLDYIILGSGTYGSIIKLSQRSFIQEDLAQLTDDPTDIVRWRLGEDIGLSTLYVAEDSVFAVIEGKDIILYEIGFNSNNRILIVGDQYAWNNNVEYGLQKLRLTTENVTLPYDLITNFGVQVVNNGEKIIDFY